MADGVLPEARTSGTVTACRRRFRRSIEGEGSDPGRRPRNAIVRGDLGATEADGRDWRTTDPLASDEDLFGPWHH